MEAGRIAARQHGRIARPQLLEASVGRHAISRAVERGWLIIVHLGVYAVAGSPFTREAGWMAAVLAGGEHARLSHRSACELWDLVRPIEGPIHVTTPTGGRRRPGIRFHRSGRGDADLKIVKGIPATSAEQALVGYAAWASPGQLRNAVEGADRRDILDPSALYALCRGNRRGTGRLAALALECAPSVDTWSPLERDFLRFCTRERLPIPLVNVEVEGWTVDCYWPDRGVVVELDSWGFHRTHEQFELDRRRDMTLQLAGLRTFRVTNRRLRRDRDALSRELRSALCPS